jgi:hypothetical protein
VSKDKPEPGFYEVAPGVVVAFSGDEDPIGWLNEQLDALLAEGPPFRVLEGPDEQDDTDDKDPEPGEPIRQVPGEKERDTRVN